MRHSILGDAVRQSTLSYMVANSFNIEILVDILLIPVHKYTAISNVHYQTDRAFRD